jgi:putative methyltransferase (TIGR04325 family)
MRRLLHELLPPVCFRGYRYARNLCLRKKSAYQPVFSGDYQSWVDAEAATSGYDAPIILQRVLDAARQVKAGTAAFERDSVLYQVPAFNWPVLSAVLWLGSILSDGVRVVDFGGSLGSLYFQHRQFWRPEAPSSWSVVEQPHFVEAGQREFSDVVLGFFSNVIEATEQRGGDLLILSSVLQYLPDPHATLNSLLQYPWKAVIIDRTSVLPSGVQDRLTIQRVPKQIYDAVYPAWFFGNTSLDSHFQTGFKTAARWTCADHYRLEDAEVSFEGRLYVRNDLWVSTKFDTLTSSADRSNASE